MDKQPSVMLSRCIALLLLACSCTTAYAAVPSGQQLLEACEQAQASGFKGPRALVCEWYAIPCDCAGMKSEPSPRVCLPADYDVRDLVSKVTAGLKDSPELRNGSADTAVAVILSRHYPCDQ
jgi:hypothetical protein